MPEQLTVQLASYETDSTLSRSSLSPGVSNRKELHAARPAEHKSTNTNSRSLLQNTQDLVESGLINSSQIVDSSANNCVVLRPSLDSAGIATNTNRFSCNELESLKERFVDFIKLDPNASSAANNLAMNTSFVKATTSGDGGLMTKPFPKSKSMQIYQDRNSLLGEMDYQTFSQCKSGQQLKQNNQTLAKNLNGARYLSRLSVVSSEYSSAESSVSTSSSSSSTNRPEPPQRTVSIRNSQCIYSSSSSASSTSCSSISPTLSTSNEDNLRNDEQTYARLPTAAEIQRANVKEDTASIRSGSIYGTSSYRGPSFIPSSQSSFSINNNYNNQNNNNNIVRSSRSVFSIYEEEDETAHLNSSATITNLSGGNGPKPFFKLENLTDSEIRRIESMYRSMGCVVSVSPCTCDLFTTTSEHIANRLNDCWNLEISSIVPVWLFDTGLNPKRKKQLRLLFVDKCTAFPIGATQKTTSTSSILNSFSKPILINESNLPKNPDNDKSITFTLNNRQIVCLVQFNCFTSCQSFFKFFTDLLCNPNYSKLFNQPESLDFKSESSSRFSFIKTNKNHSQSLLSLTKLNQNGPKISNQKKSNRHSELISSSVNFTPDSLSGCNRMKSSQTWDSLKHLDAGSGKNDPKKDRVRVTGITKSCISNPCAFQHINSIKDGDQRLKMFVNFKSK